MWQELKNWSKDHELELGILIGLAIAFCIDITCHLMNS